MGDKINLVKLCVGAEKLDDLRHGQQLRMASSQVANPRHVTRMWPKREAELAGKGSLYWVIKGLILARQEVVRLDEVIGDDGIRRCALILSPQIIETEPQPRRAFQGWRYLRPEDAPADRMRLTKDETPLPPQLALALAEIGIRQ